MRDELKKKCDLFIANKANIKKGFPFSTTPAAGSMLLTGRDRELSVDQLKALNKTLAEHEGVFSSLRQHMREPVLCMMALSDDPGQYITRMRETFSKLNKRRIFENEYDVISAMILNNKSDDAEVEKFIDKTLEVYDLMREHHAVLTTGEDMPFATIIAATGKDPNAILNDAERCYTLLRERFPMSGAVQPLAHILALNPASPEEKVKKTIDLYEEFKKAGLRYGKSYELAALGPLVALDMTPEEIVAETREAYDYLKDNHAYGLLEASKEEKVLNASMMVLMSHHGEMQEEMQSAALSAQLAIAITIELVVICAVSSAVINSMNH